MWHAWVISLRSDLNQRLCSGFLALKLLLRASQRRSSKAKESWGWPLRATIEGDHSAFVTRRSEIQKVDTSLEDLICWCCCKTGVGLFRGWHRYHKSKVRWNHFGFQLHQWQSLWCCKHLCLRGMWVYVPKVSEMSFPVSSEWLGQETRGRSRLFAKWLLSSVSEFKPLADSFPDLGCDKSNKLGVTFSTPRSMKTIAATKSSGCGRLRVCFGCGRNA